MQQISAAACSDCVASAAYGTCPHQSHAATQQAFCFTVAGSEQADERFAELMENVSTVLSHFNERVEAARATGGWDWSVARVLDVIKGPFLAYSSSCLVSIFGSTWSSC